MFFKNIPTALTALLCLLYTSLYSQTATFQQTYGGPGYDAANDVLETADGYLIVGNTFNPVTNNSEAILIHLNKTGEVLWKKSYGQFINYWFSQIIAGNDGGFLLSGSIQEFNGGPGSGWLVKIDDDGDIIWQKTISAQGNSIITIPDGYIFSGVKVEAGVGQPFVTRIDNNGNTMWSRSTPSPGGGFVYAQYIVDSLIYLTGRINVPNNSDNKSFAYWRTMNTATGDVVQSREYQVDTTNVMENMHLTSEGNHIMTGATSKYLPGVIRFNGWVQKVNSTGEILWSKTYKIADGNGVSASKLLADGSLILAMRVSSITPSNIQGSALIKIDAQGAVVWARIFEGRQNIWTQIRQTADGGFFATGYKLENSESFDINAFWIKTDSLGIVEGCCTANAMVIVENVSPTTQQVPVEENDFEETLPFDLATVDTATVEVQNFCFSTQPIVSRTLAFYLGQTVTLGDSTYSQPGVVTVTLPSITGGCDTLAIYTLELLDSTQHQAATFLQEYKGLLFDQANDILETDEGYLIAGETQNTDIDHLEALLIHINKSGAVLWKKTYSHISQCVINRIIAANDGGYLLWGTISGYSFYEAGAWLAKIDNDGNLIWQKFLPMQTVGTNIIAIPDGYILSGGTVTNVGPHYYSFVTRVDNTGNTLWSRSMPSSAFTYDLSVQYAVDSLLYLTGSIMFGPPSSKAFACLKTMDLATGAIVQSWEYKVDSFNNIYTMHRTPEGNHIMTGSTSRGVSGSMPYNGWVQKVNSAGEVLWSKTYQIGDGILIYASEMLADGSLVLAMNSSSYTPDVVQRGALIKIDAQGAVVWARRFESLGSWTQIHQTDDGGFFITGYKPESNSTSNGNAFWMKTDSLGIVADCCVANATVIVENVFPTTLQIPFEEEEFEELSPYDLAVEGLATEEVADFCFNTQPTIEQTLVFCPGQSVTLGDSTYSQSGVVTLSLPSTTGGCDTLATYTLELLGQITISDTIAFCAGQTITLGDSTYSQPTTVQLIIPATTGGCDTLATYTLELLDLPTINRTLSFCSGQTITLGDSTYSAPTTVNLIIPSSIGGCDTLATYTLEFSDSPVINQTLTFCSGQTVTLADSTYSAPTTVYLIIPSSTGDCDTVATYTLEFSDLPVINQTLTFCAGQTITLGDSTYNQPTTVQLIIPATTGGCDTLAIYTLEFLNLPTINRTLSFCSGQTVTLGDSIYNQPTTVQLIIPATTGGCDTLATYTLELLDLPTISRTISFCPNQTVTLGDSTYNQPGIVTILIPATTGGCDTLATYTLAYKTTNQPNTVQITCPNDITTTILPGATSTLVNYNLPTATSDCPCPGMLVDLSSGGASGSLFPVGTNTVCYRAEDACGNEKTCCFTINVEEGAGCDEKTTGCVKFELLTVQRDAGQNWVYRVRITNNCSSEMTYAYVQVPNGLQAIQPINNSTYSAPGGYTYTVRNPNFSPFYSLRFKPVAGGLVDGQSDVFRYLLPEQADVEYIHVATRLASDIYYETYLNTFNCPIGTEYVTDGAVQSTDRSNIVSNGIISVFPNPATSGTTLSITGEEIANGDFLLQDVMGRTVLQNRIVDNQVQLNQHNFTAGVYFFKIFANGEFVGSGKISLF